MAKKKNKDGFTTTDYIVGGSALFLIGKYLLFPSMTREDAVKIIVAAGHTSQDYTDQKLWGTNYLTAWAAALRKNFPTFKLNNSLYDTKTGKKIG